MRGAANCARKSRRSAPSWGLTEALVAGGQLQAIVTAIKEREGRRQRLAEELAIIEGAGRLGDLDVERLRRTLAERLDDWRGLLRRQPVQARQILRKLVVGRLIFYAKIDEQGRYYEFRRTRNARQVLTGAFHARAMVTPAGSDRIWTPEFQGVVASR